MLTFEKCWKGLSSEEVERSGTRGWWSSGPATITQSTCFLAFWSFRVFGSLSMCTLCHLVFDLECWTYHVIHSLSPNTVQNTAHTLSHNMWLTKIWFSSLTLELLECPTRQTFTVIFMSILPLLVPNFTMLWCEHRVSCHQLTPVTHKPAQFSTLFSSLSLPAPSDVEQALEK